MTPWLFHKVQNLHPPGPASRWPPSKLCLKWTGTSANAFESSTELTVFLKLPLHFLELSINPKKDNHLAQKYKAPYIPSISSHRFTKKRRSQKTTSRFLAATPITWCNPSFTDLESRLQQTAPAWTSDKEEFRMEKCELWNSYFC